MPRISKMMSVVVLCELFAGNCWGAELAPKLGAQVAEFTLQDFRGAAHALSDVKQAKLVVVAFLGVECPISKLYGPRLAQLAAKYADQGVAFLGVDPNRQDAVTSMAHFAKEHGIEFPFLKDLNNRLAEAMGASRVPQVFVLDGQRAIRYVGRIDDEYGFDTGSGYAKTRVNNTDLINALDELLAGKTVSNPQTTAIGCLIGRVLTADANSDVTYSNQIARIFQEHCENCHRPGQIGPFALQNFEQAAGWAEMIAEVVRDRRMPPWHPDPAFGHFKNDISLSDQEKVTIYKWVAAGAPQGDPKDLPEPRQHASDWMMPGGPDAVVYMTPEPVSVKAEGTEAYRYYSAETGFTEDKWVTMTEVVPGNRSVVHHIIVYVAPPSPALAAVDGGAAPVRRGAGGQPGNYLTVFAPGTRPQIFAPGMAKLIPAGSRLTFQMHYTPNGTPQTDRSYIGLKFCDASEVTHRVATGTASNAQFVIPAGDPNYLVESDREYKKDLKLLSVFPHMHVRGKDFHYQVIYPDGTTEVLMNMPRYDFNWQTDYIFNQPKDIPAGTRLHCTAHFDNSADNPANPDPTKPVRWGDQTWEEMMIGWFDFAVPKDVNLADVLSADRRGFQARAAEAPPQ